MFCKIKPVISKGEKKSDTLIFAAEELCRYLRMAAGGECLVIPSEHYSPEDRNTIWLGVDLSGELPEAKDPLVDDNILIQVENFAGLITGTNARSVLIGVYRFLREKGYQFLRPGPEGEIIPDRIDGMPVRINEQASYRYRIMCIEGSVFQENLMATIDWLPKVAMNGYLVQFLVPQEFFDRWYSENNPYRDTCSVSPEEVLSMLGLLEREIEKRDLQYHAIGHGWTSEPFGIRATSWDSMEVELSPETTELMAMLAGKRGLWNGSAMSTHLCYSNPVARTKVVDTVVEYLKEHRNITHLHFWLADGGRNYCECDACQKGRVADYYVAMCNQLDAMLTEAGMDTRIVFEAGYGSLWKPLKERIANSNRFVLMLAPITRSFSMPLERDASVEMMPYELNRFRYPKTGPECVAYLDDWHTIYQGDSLDFDYHFTWDHYFDFAQYWLGQVLHQDMVNLRSLGMDGLISCQAQRAFLPSCLGMQVMARTLWDRTVSFEDVARQVLSAEFGPDYPAVTAYLERLSEYGRARVIRCEERITEEGVEEDWLKALEILDGFRPEILKNIERYGSHRLGGAWEKLDFHNRLYYKMIQFYLNCEGPDKDVYANAVMDYARKHEVRFRDEFDAMYFNWTFELLIIPRLKHVEVIK